MVLILLFYQTLTVLEQSLWVLQSGATGRSGWRGEGGEGSCRPGRGEPISEGMRAGESGWTPASGKPAFGLSFKAEPMGAEPTGRRNQWGGANREAGPVGRGQEGRGQQEAEPMRRRSQQGQSRPVRAAPEQDLKPSPRGI